MCGRIALKTSPDRLAGYLGATVAAGTDESWRPRFNVAPTASIFGVYEVELPAQASRTTSTMRVLQRWRWGLLPSWVKDPAKAPSMFNARAETVATKPAFRAAFNHKRLLIPVDAFYEWHRSGGAKQPHAFVRADGEPLVFAGLWQPWTGPDGKIVQTATIITTTAGPDIGGIHDRQPVVLDPDQWALWLDPAVGDTSKLMPLLQPPLKGTLRHYRVGFEVGNTRNDGPELLEPLATPV